jgi:excisionase family DNA binding protein
MPRSVRLPAPDNDSKGPERIVPTFAPIAYRPKEAALAMGISEALLYELIATGEIAARKLRGATVLLRSDIEAYLAGLPLTGAAMKAAQASIR